MRSVALVHWNAAEAEERLLRLRRSGFRARALFVAGPDPAALHELTAEPPDAIVIDLSRLPSQGRDVGLSLRVRKSLRRVPLVFVDGAPEKVERVRWTLPDAVFTTWAAIQGELARAIAHPPSAPHVPSSRLEGYSGRPLAAKLGIKAGDRVGLIGAPDDFERTLGTLPEAAATSTGARGSCALVVWFVKKRADVEKRIAAIAAREDWRALWIAWPKQAAVPDGRITQSDVRELGLSAGLVDFKVCAIDATWSGLCFARRKKPARR